jgi:AcrR family transcriptional regulator
LTGKYRLQLRAVRQEETRQRIVTAAVELHTTVGPAHTTDAAVARKAGVTRVTFYRHFPDAGSLFRACTAHGLERWPPPEPDPWRRIRDPEARLRVALEDLYAYYRVAGPGLTVIIRDAPLLSLGLLASPSRLDALRSMTAVLLVGWGARGPRRRLLKAALNHVTSVRTWQSLVQEGGLKEREAVELLVAMVRSAARRREPPADPGNGRAHAAGPTGSSGP